MLLDCLDNLLFAVTFLHVEVSIVLSLLEISSMSWFYFWKKDTGYQLNAATAQAELRFIVQSRIYLRSTGPYWRGADVSLLGYQKDYA